MNEVARCVFGVVSEIERLEGLKVKTQINTRGFVDKGGEYPIKHPCPSLTDQF